MTEFLGIDALLAEVRERASAPPELFDLTVASQSAWSNTASKPFSFVEYHAAIDRMTKPREPTPLVPPRGEYTLMPCEAQPIPAHGSGEITRRMERFYTRARDFQEGMARAFNATCTRCGGPATMLLTSTQCERAGGCRTFDQRHQSQTYRLDANESGERLWCTGDPRGRAPYIHPTREGSRALYIAAMRQDEAR